MTMRILWLKVGGLWPANVGGRLRSLHMLAALAQRHRVTVLTTHGPDDDPAGLERELAACERVISLPYALPKRGSAAWFLALGRSWLSRLPLDLSKCRVPALERRARELLCDASAPFDLCVADFLVATPNLPARCQVPIVHFSHNVEHLLWQRLCHAEARPVQRALLELEWRKMQRCEAEACARAQLTIAVSDADGAVLGALSPHARVRSIATGVDAAYFAPDDTAGAAGSLVFTGAMDWYPNEDGILDFVAHTLPLIRRELCAASLTVVGRNPSLRLRALHGVDGVNVTGTVPDVRPYVARAEVYVVPLRIGGGTRLKILEALAMGKAVVSTRIGAEGLPLIDGEHFVAADTPGDFARAVVTLLRDPARRQALARAGRSLVEERHTWARVTDQFEQLCKEAVYHAS
jgi:glycosyltransferase involved in cell wall biosynthesis